MLGGGSLFNPSPGAIVAREAGNGPVSRTESIDHFLLKGALKDGYERIEVR
jgi:hypothetical protein